ncbi:hypothetical protein M011DRAFT_474789 [Sporormia fimetaria CBS 119925]|uniref:Sister chromatid cohesion protein-like protein Dcc1 n=1 Tax=Sporormia fimetaria CBS 119925 TaxID=1340428 RepID=A0A6A6VKK6_9PLEO|nr:hypothetical protein M011DRAFT_474789 [Sporormia fimetaria CBS 119925]
MATQQGEGGVPFSIAHDFQSFRLLELPQDLVELLETPNPPHLCIKSQIPSPTTASNAKPAYAVLCTPDKTFQLRQVQTSNSLFVTQAVLEHHGNDIPVPTTRAIATCPTTLELHPSDGSPVAMLEQALPLYDIIEGEVDAVGSGKEKEDILSHIPFSQAECVRAWTSLAAFEHLGSSYQPSATALCQVWKSINASAIADGVKLDEQFLSEDVSKGVVEDGHPVELAEAILRRLSGDDQDTKGPWTSLDRVKTVHFVGRTLLEAKRGGGDYLTADFVDAWKECLPEHWRDDAQLTAIDGLYELPSTTTVRLKGTTTKPSEGAPKASTSSRRWHEKFAKMRKR